MHFEDNETLEAARARNIRDALQEDIGRCDWTAELVPADRRVQARVVAKEDGVLCGRDWFDGCMHGCDASIRIDWAVAEGARFPAGTELCRIDAPARALLSAERASLNFLQMLSAVATVTRQHVDAIEGLSPNPNGCVVLDTRKTLPGLRQAQKYAVRVGGGANQRMALWHGILIKENHIAAAGGITAALKAAQALDSGVSIQIEVENLAELEEALDAGATSVLIDDFSFDDMRAAVALNRGRALLEVSGGVDMTTIREIAATGVDRVSIGRLTKDVRAIDLSMRVLPAARELAPGLVVRGVEPPLRLSDFRLIAFDMDSTLINIECIDEIADAAGRKAEVAAITAAAMRGEITDFKDSLRRRVALLAGVPVAALEAVWTERLRLNPGAEALVRACQAAGLKIVLVSGGFTFFTDRLRDLLQIDHTRSNLLEIDADGRLTGRVLDQDWGDICDGEEKRRTVLALCAHYGIDPRQAIAMGDGANDLPMMGAVGLSVAHHAKPAVRERAMVAIESGGLDRLLEVVRP
jgi:nicotinate-nucleotide pyrophosphorylase (carboxylating)